MSWHLFAMFFASMFFISATPGPNMLLAFQYGMNYGVKRTLWTLAGLSLGLFLSETIWQIVYTLGGKKLASWLDVGSRLAWLNRGCGVIFILIAAALLAEVLNGFMV